MKAEDILKSEEFKKITDFHGHLCPGVAIGYRAAREGMDLLEAGRSRDEELVAIVDNDACGADAVQVLTGCTFGKGNFIHRDYGKQAFTFFRRGSGRAVRLAMRPGAIDGDESLKVDREIFDRVRSGEATEEEQKIFQETRIEKVRRILEMSPEELFKIEEKPIEPPEKAVVMSSETCARCGEPAMPLKMKEIDGKLVCRECLDKENG